MNKTKTILCFCTIAIMLFCMIPTLSMKVEAAPQPTKYVPGEVIIGLKESSIASFLPVISGLGASVKGGIPQLNAVVVKVAAGAEEEFVKAVKSLPGVAYVERNGIGEAAFVPNDTYWGSQWNMLMIKADKAWDTFRDGRSYTVTIAILDTGVDYTHSDLIGNYQSGGYDWVNDDSSPMDDHTHGTHCAGIAAATLNNALGVAGVAQVKIWAEKILSSTGSGSNDDLASGILHAADNDVNVISMSLQNYPYSTLVENAIDYAYYKGVLLVGAAGNAAKNIDVSPSYPASYANVIAVSATKSDDTFDWSYSNYGNKIEVSAPGTSVYSTLANNSYGYMSGTSMACPHVAGLAALIWSYKPQLTSGQVRSALQTSVDDKGAVGKDIYYGYGRINCLKTISSPEKYQYKFALSGYIERVYVNVTSQTGGMLINGKVNASTGPHPAYPAPVLGWASGNNFYMIFDWRTTPGIYELGLLVGTVSTASGKLYRTSDGTTWAAPLSVTLVSFAEVTPDSEQGSAAAEVETAAIQYVEGLNPAQPVGAWTADAQEFAVRYVPTISYPLKKVELMLGLKTGLITVQLRSENASGYPSSNVLRQVTFIMSSTVGWQGAEFDTSYPLIAGTPYWIVYTAISGMRSPIATSGTNIAACWDYYNTGYGWENKTTVHPYMAKFYREVQPKFQYHFTLSPFIDKVYVNVTSQTGGMLIYGLANVTSDSLSYPAPVLGWAVGNSFYMPLDFRTAIGSGGYDLGFIVGTVSTASGKLYRTIDGTKVDGPTAVTLVAFAETAKEKTKPTSATP